MSSIYWLHLCDQVIRRSLTCECGVLQVTLRRLFANNRNRDSLFAGIYWTMVPLGPTPIHSQSGTNNTTSAPAALNSSGGGSTKSNSSVVCINSAILWCIIALVRKIITYNPKFRANVKSDIILQTWQHYLLPFGLINAQWLTLRPLRFKMTLLSPSDMWKIFCDRFPSLFYYAPPQIVYQN